MYPNNGSNLAGALGLEPRAYGFGGHTSGMKSRCGPMLFSFTAILTQDLTQQHTPLF